MPMFEQFASEVSIIGCNKLFSSSLPTAIRVTWLILLVAGVSTTMFLVSERLRHYASGPVGVEMSLRTANSLPFPAVTLCNENQVSRHYLERDELIEQVEWYLYMRNLYLTTHPLALASSKEHYTNYTYGNWTLPVGDYIYRGVHGDHANPLSEHQWQQAAIELYNNSIMWFETLEENRELCIFHKVFCPDNRIEPIWTDIGLCWQFNGRLPGLTANGTGRTNGLVLKYDLQISKQVFSYYDSAIIMIHQPGERPDIATAMNLMPGGKWDVGLVESRTQLLLDGEEDDQHLARISWCRAKCEAKYELQQCGCSRLEVHGLGNEYNITCTTLAKDVCARSAAWEWLSATDIQEACSCGRQKVFIHYQIDKSFAPYSAVGKQMESKERYMINGSASAYAESNFVELYVYYHTLTSEHIRQIPAYTFWSMMSDLGGALGLFTGSALFTIVEIIHILAGWAVSNINDNKINHLAEVTG